MMSNTVKEHCSFLKLLIIYFLKNLNVFWKVEKILIKNYFNEIEFRIKNQMRVFLKVIN